MSNTCNPTNMNVDDIIDAVKRQENTNDTLTNLEKEASALEQLPLEQLNSLLTEEWTKNSPPCNPLEMNAFEFIDALISKKINVKGSRNVLNELKKKARRELDLIAKRAPDVAARLQREKDEIDEKNAKVEEAKAHAAKFKDAHKADQQVQIRQGRAGAAMAKHAQDVVLEEKRVALQAADKELAREIAEFDAEMDNYRSNDMANLDAALERLKKAGIIPPTNGGKSRKRHKKHSKRHRKKHTKRHRKKHTKRHRKKHSNSYKKSHKHRK